MSIKKAVLPLFLLLITLFINSCTQQEDNYSTAQKASISIKNSAFNPSTITIKVGTTITWTNEDSILHDVTINNGLFKLKGGEQIILEKNKIGLVVGLFLAIIHAIWSILVAIIPNGLQSFLDWRFGIHFLEPVLKLTEFNFMGAILLIIIAFISGF